MSANSLTPIMHKILARGLMVLREQVIMPRLVNFDYDTEAAEKGDVINVPVPTAQTAIEIEGVNAPAEVPPAPASVHTKTVPINLNKWYHSDFHLTDKQLTEIDRNESFVPMQMGESVRALANVVNQDIWSHYVGVWGFVGTAGVTPFSGGIDDAVQVRKELNIQLCPRGDRRCVLDYVAEAEALKQAPFRDASASTDRAVLIEGEIGRKYGIEWFADDHVPTHTAGSHALAELAANTADPTALSQVVTLESAGTGSIEIGDIITIVGDSQKYAVTSGDANVAGGGVITIQPGLQITTTGNDLIINASGTTDHVVNLAFHRDAFAFATRPLASSMADLELGHRIASMQDPVSGIVLRLEVSRQFKQTVWDLDILWGSALVRPELAARILG